MYFPKTNHSPLHLLHILSLSSLLFLCLFTSCSLYQNQAPDPQPIPQPVPESGMIPKWEGIYEGTYTYHYEAEEEIYDSTTGEFLEVGIVVREEEKEIRVIVDWETETEMAFSEEMNVVRQIEFSLSTSISDPIGPCWQHEYHVGYSARKDKACLVNSGDGLSIRREVLGRDHIHRFLKVLITFEGDRVQ